MSTEEIFSYLFDIGLVPQAMEWVNDACCKLDVDGIFISGKLMGG